MWLFILSFSLVASSVSSNLRFYKEGESAIIDCTGEGEVQYWFLHGKGEAIDATQISENVRMLDNGTLSFKNVSKDHDGSHVCVTRIHTTYKAYHVKMPVRPLTPSNLWDARYKQMFFTGLISALVILALFIGIWLVSRFRYRPPTVSGFVIPRAAQQSYDNPVLVDEKEDNEQYSRM